MNDAVWRCVCLLHRSRVVLVESWKLIVSALANVRRERRDRAGIARFELGKRIQIGLRFRIFVLSEPKGLKDAQSLSLASQKKITNWPPTEVLHLGNEGSAHTNASAELLVGGFQPRRDIDGIPVRCVIEESAAAEIADDRRSGMSTDAGILPYLPVLPWQ